MSSPNIKKVMRILKSVYAELEKEAIEEGIDITSPEYEALVDEARATVLAKMGITLEEYKEFKEKNTPATKAEIVGLMDEINVSLKAIENMHIPTKEEIAAIADEIVKKNLKPPQIINQIVKEVTIEKPQIIKETRIEHTIKQETYDDKPLKSELKNLSKKVEDIHIPEPLDVAKLRKEMRAEFDASLSKSIDILGMPDFRKLAMGLQAQIDDVRNNSGGGLSVLEATGDVDDSNTDFIFTSEPVLIAINGVLYEKTGGSITWTYAGVTASLSAPVGSGGKIFGLG